MPLGSPRVNGDSSVPFLYSVFIFSVAVALYALTYRHQFTFDDYFHVLGNAQVKDAKSLLVFFTQATWPGDLFRPVNLMTYALTYKFVGADPVVYHITNIILYALVCSLAYFMLSHILGWRVGLFSAVLFTLHPVHVEVVSNVSYRPELLSSLFILFFILLVIDQREMSESIVRRAIRSTLMILFTLLALLSKESSVCLLLLAPLAALGSFGFSKGLKKSAKPLEAVVIALVAYLMLRANALGEFGFGAVTATTGNFLDNPIYSLEVSARVLNACVLLGRYLVLLFMPWRLSADYSYAQVMPLSEYWSENAAISAQAISFLFVAAALFVISLVSALKNRKVAFCGLWFFCSFLVTSNVLFPIGTIFGERLAFLGSIGICGLLALFVAKRRAFMWRVFLGAAFCGFFAYQSFNYAAAWSDNETLFARELKNSSKSARVHSNFAFTLLQKGELDKAMEHFTTALVIHPEYIQASMGVARIYIEKSYFEGAIAELQKIVEKNPAHVDSLSLLARLIFNEGDLEEASSLFQKVLKLSPGNRAAKQGLLAVAIAAGKVDEARKMLEGLKAAGAMDSELKELERSLELSVRERRSLP